MVYINRIENKITFKIKAGYNLELLTLEAMKLLGSTKRKITKDENGKNVPYLEITEVILVHFNIVNNDYQHDSRVFLIRVFLINIMSITRYFTKKKFKNFEDRDRGRR